MIHLFNKMASAKKRYYTHEVLLLVLFASAVFLLCSLISFNPHDPSWFYQTTVAVAITNWCGWLGAHTAATLFYLMGSSSFILAFFLFFICYLMVVHRKMKTEWDRVMAFAGLLFIMPTLSAVFAVDYFSSPYPGGYIGNFFEARLLSFFDRIGTHIFLYTMMLICLIILLRFSFIGLVSKAMNHISLSFMHQKIFLPLAHSCSFIKNSYVKVFYFFKNKFTRLIFKIWPTNDESVEFEGGIIDQAMLHY